MVRLVQYNMLSESLSNQKFYVQATPEEVNGELRWAKIKTKLQEHMTCRSVICLQELGKKWAGKLHVLCYDNKYHMINDHYGADFSDYMGNAICVPDEYKVTDVVITKVGDLVPKEMKETKKETLYSSTTSSTPSPPSTSSSPSSSVSTPTTPATSSTPSTPVTTMVASSPFYVSGPITAGFPVAKRSTYSSYLNALLGYFGYNIVPVSSTVNEKTTKAATPQFMFGSASPAPAPSSVATVAQAQTKTKEFTKSNDSTDLWKVAATRYNTCISVKLEFVSLSNTVLLTNNVSTSDVDSDDDGTGDSTGDKTTTTVTTESDLKKVLWVHTYHMPCAFTTPQLMTIHSCLFLQHVQRLSGPVDPYVICVDFNTAPDSAQYQLYTEGVIDPQQHADSIPVVPSPPSLSSSTSTNSTMANKFVCQVQPVKSAYKTMYSSEPAITCSTYTKFPSAESASSFQGCIDYIFYGNGCRVNYVDLVESIKPDEYMPSLVHPSDHLELVAHFDL